MVSFASRTTPSGHSNRTDGATGPNVSSWARRIVLTTSVITVGLKNVPELPIR